MNDFSRNFRVIVFGSWKDDVVIRKTSRSTLFIAGLALACLMPQPVNATSTSAHAMVVSGHAGHPGGGIFDCATSGPQTMEGAYFGSASVGLPTEGYSYCGLAGGIQDKSNASGPSAASETVNNPYSHGTHVQTAAAIADFAVLKASSAGSYTGDDIGGFAYHDGEAAAYSTDTIPLPAGAKFVQFGLSIDGTASVTGNSQTLSILDYQINGGLIYGAFTADLLGSTASVTGLNGTGSGDVAGFTVVPGSVSGGGTVTSFRSDVSGASFDLTLALLAASYPQQGGGIANNDFSETARLSSLSFFDAAGNPIAFGTITGASGRLYDATGVHIAAVDGLPEPATWGMLLIGFGCVGTAARRGQQDRSVTA